MIARWGLLLVALAGCGHSRTVLRGRVVDEQGRGIRGAVVETEPMTDVVRTDADGRFEISAELDARGDPGPLTVEAVEIRAHRPGYARARRAVPRVRGSTNVEALVLVADADEDERAPDEIAPGAARPWPIGCP